MKTSHVKDTTTQLAACVAPEDLICGDYVAILNVIHEYPPFFWCCDSAPLEVAEPIKIKFKETNAGLPLKVKAICLPFVFVKLPCGSSQSLDVRLVQLARLKNGYAKKVWRHLKVQGSKPSPFDSLNV